MAFSGVLDTLTSVRFFYYKTLEMLTSYNWCLIDNCEQTRYIKKIVMLLLL